MATNPTGTTELIDTGERRDTLGRVVMPKERRLELVRAWQTSGLTQAAFAKREGVRYSTFAHWVQQAMKKTATVRPARVKFAEVALPPALVPALEVRLPEGTEAGSLSFTSVKRTGGAMVRRRRFRPGSVRQVSHI